MENAVDYLSILLNDIEQSKNFLAAYNNIILILQSQYGAYQTEDFAKLSKAMNQQERIELLTTIGYLRSYCSRSYINFQSIKSHFKDNEKINEIEENYKKIKTQVTPSFDVLEKFVQNLNDLFVKEINVKALINTNQKMNYLAQNSAAPEY